MTGSIVLVRHGPSALVLGGAIDRAGLLRWRDEYDEAGIVPEAQPPAALVRIADRATHIVSSDLRRAVESAERLAPKRPIRTSDLLREAGIAIPHWPTRLPLAGWGTVTHASWLLQIIRGTDATPEDRARAVAGAEWLAAMVSDGSTALVVIHGLCRRLIAQHLLVRGWTSAGRRGGYRHWSAWSFARAERRT